MCLADAAVVYSAKGQIRMSELKDRVVDANRPDDV